MSRRARAQQGCSMLAAGGSSGLDRVCMLRGACCRGRPTSAQSVVTNRPCSFSLAHIYSFKPSLSILSQL